MTAASSKEVTQQHCGNWVGSSCRRDPAMCAERLVAMRSAAHPSLQVQMTLPVPSSTEQAELPSQPPLSVAHGLMQLPAWQARPAGHMQLGLRRGGAEPNSQCGVPPAPPP